MIDVFRDVSWITPDLRCQTHLLILCFSVTSFTIWRSGSFFTLSPLYFSEPCRKRKAVVCDWWIAIRFVCFCVSRLVALFLKSTISFTLALRFFLTSLHWNMGSLDSKGEIVPIELPNPENTATEGWKRTGTFPLTFTFADKRSECYGNGLIDVVENIEFGACSIWIVEDVARGSFLFPTYLGRSKETLFAG